MYMSCFLKWSIEIKYILVFGKNIHYNEKVMEKLFKVFLYFTFYKFLIMYKIEIYKKKIDVQKNGTEN